MKHRNMAQRQHHQRPQTSRGPNDRRKRNNRANNSRGNGEFENEEEFSFPGNQQQQNRSNTRSYIGRLEMRETSYPSENMHLTVPAVKGKFTNRTTTAQKVRNNAVPVKKPTGRDTRRSSSFLRQAQRAQAEEISPANPVYEKVKSFGSSMVTTGSRLLFGNKRSPPSSQKAPPKKQKRITRTTQQDSLVASTPQAPHEYVGAKRSRKSPPKEQIIDLVDGDSDTEDESSPKKRWEDSNSTQSKRKSSLFTGVVQNRVSKKQAGKQTEKQTSSSYAMCEKVAQQVKEAVPDTPSDTEEGKVPSPTKHAIHSDVDSSSENESQPDTVRQGSLSTDQDLERSRRGFKAVIPSFRSNTSAGPTSDGEEDDNLTQDDSDSDEGCFSFLPKGTPRKSKPTARLQVAQHAAKTRKNADLDDINNFSQKKKKKKTESRKEAPETQPIVLDGDDDENDGTNANTASKYFESQQKDDVHPKVLPHPGMTYHDMQMYPNEPGSQTPASLDLPADLVAGSNTNTDSILKDYDPKTKQWKHGAKPSASRHHDSDGEEDFWGDVTGQQPKSTKDEPYRYSPEDSKASRRARKVEEVDEVLVDSDEEYSPVRNLARAVGLQKAGIDSSRNVALRKAGPLLSFTKVNGAAKTKKSRKGKPIVPGASTEAFSKSQETTSSQESRGWSERPRRSNRKSLNPYGTSRFNNSQQEDPDYTYAQNLQEQEDLFEASRRRMSRGRSAKKKKKPATNEDEPIVLSSDSEEEEQEELQNKEYDLFRISLGKKVYSNSCLLTFLPRSNELTLDFCKSKRKTRNSNPQPEKVYFKLNQETLKEFKFYEQKKSGNDESFDNAVGFSFVAIRVTPAQSNNLATYPNHYKPESEDAPNKSRYVVLQFRIDGDFEDFRTKMHDHLSGILPPGEIAKEEAFSFAEALVDDSQRMATSRRAMENQSAFIKGRNDDSVLLVYPFAGDSAEIEAAANGLQEPSGKLSSDASDDESEEEETSKMQSSNTAAGDVADSKEEAVSKVKVRQHYVTLRVKDYERLEPQEWLNDSLVDFWMQWIARSEDKSDTNLHFFTSHFYSALATGGTESVTSWTAKKNINIFEKKFIFIPINKDLHWSLCAVVNPGCIMNSYESDLDKKGKLDVPCLIFMDSLKMHKKNTIRKKIENWLNSEWKRIKPGTVEDPFSLHRFQLFSPTVPMQNNTWDCGVFVCRYALAIFKLRNRSFTFRDVHGNSPFSRLVTGGAEFDFDMDDIVRFRGEFQTLIENLSRVWTKWKREGAKPKPKTDDDEKSSGQEVNDETPEDKSIEQEMADGPQEADEVSGLVASERETTSCPPSGSPTDESMDVVNENESDSLATEANASFRYDPPSVDPNGYGAGAACVDI